MNTFRFTMIAAATAVAALASSGAMAAVVTFDFAGSDSRNYFNLSSAVTQTEGGLTVTAEGKAISGGLTFGNTLAMGLILDAKIGSYPGGLGVVTYPLDNSQVEGGILLDEFIQFSFDSSIRLRSVSFDLVGNNSGFRWGYDSNNDGAFGLGDWLSGGLDVPSSTVYADFGDVISSVFAIGAFGVNDEWKLKSMTVEYDPSVVPLPASALLLGAALGGFGVVARRRKKAA